MEWGGRQGLDSAALKRAKVPIYGKWYFPDLPANEPLVNLSTGEIETFPAGYRAGAVLYVKEADLKQAGLGPYKAAPAPAAAAPAAVAAPVAEPVAVAAAPAPAAVVAAPAAHHEPPHESAAHQEARQQAAHSVGHAAPLRHDVVEHAHPGAKQYVVIAMILAMITAVEVAVYYIPGLRPYIAPILIVLSAVKFWMVVAFFMHLKFDHVSFSWYFGGGLALALTMASSVVVLQIATHGLPHGY
jgi:cytochrome c oxidase subunit 4